MGGPSEAWCRVRPLLVRRIMWSPGAAGWSGRGMRTTLCLWVVLAGVQGMEIHDLNPEIGEDGLLDRRSSEQVFDALSSALKPINKYTNIRTVTSIGDSAGDSGDDEGSAPAPPAASRARPPVTRRVQQAVVR